MTFESIDTRIPVGEPKVDSPVSRAPMYTREGHLVEKTFVRDTDQVLVYDTIDYLTSLEPGEEPQYFELAGPREKIYFDPSKVHCAIATCGGLCPGTNDVIRAIVLELYHLYGVRHIYGVRYGLQGFLPKYGHDLMDLSPEAVANIHIFGGTVLGTSRGPQDTGEIVDALDRINIRILFLIGGDGTLKAANDIYQEITRRELRICGDRHPQDHRQRHRPGEPLLRLRHRGGGGHPRHPRGPHRGGGLPQLHRPGEAHGPLLRLHRRQRHPGPAGGQFRPDSRGRLRPGRRVTVCWRPWNSASRSGATP